MSSASFTTPWAKISSREFDTWHSMCSYLGAFPPALANYFVRYFTKPKDLVMDPFAGRGTTSLEAQILGRNAVSTDLNPIALALCEAKNSCVTKDEVISRIMQLEARYDPALYEQEAFAQQMEVHLIFHPRTLAQLCYLKRKLLVSSVPVDKFLVGITLGILHGGERLDGSSGYASIDMPNTFSMSPEYVRRFVQTNQLNRLFRDVFELLRDKTERLYKKHSINKGEGLVIRANARRLAELPQLQQYLRKVSLVLTSPPYLGIVNYAKQNWIRSWFIGKNPIEISTDLDDDLSLDEWIKFAKASVKEIKKFLRKDGVAVFVIGDVARSKKNVISLAREFAMMVKEEKLFKNTWCINDTIGDGDKTTRIWAETKGNATTVDRIVFLSDINPFQKFSKAKGIEKLDFRVVERTTKYFIGSKSTNKGRIKRTKSTK